MGRVTRLTTVIYNPSLERVLGPVHATTLFEAASGADHPLLVECARRCVEDDARPLSTIERSGMGVIGCRLTVNGELVGVVVAAYAATAFPVETAVRRFAREGQVPFAPIWHAVRQTMPLTKARLSDMQ